MKLAHALGLIACLVGMAGMVHAEPPGAPTLSGLEPLPPLKTYARSIRLRTQIFRLPADKFNEFQGKDLPFGLHVGRHPAGLYSFAISQLGGKILAEPTLITTEGRPATFVAGGEIPLLAPGEKKAKADWLTHGTKLELLPRIQPDGNIWMRFRFEQTQNIEDGEAAESKAAGKGVQSLAMTAGIVSEGVATVKPGESVFAIIPDSKEAISEDPLVLVMVFTPEIAKGKDAPVLPALSEQPADMPPPEIQIQTARVAKLDYLGRTDLVLEESQTGTIESPENIRAVSGFQSEVISVSAQGPRRLQIEAKNVGMTEMLVTDVNGKQFGVLVQVNPAPTTKALPSLIKRFYPTAEIEVLTVNENLLLRGTVTQLDHIQRITEIAELFAPKVLNQATLKHDLDPETARNLIGSALGTTPTTQKQNSPPATGSPVLPTRPQPVDAFPGPALHPDEIRQLRQDVKALHADVKRLLEILKHKAAVVPKAVNPPDGLVPMYGDPEVPVSGDPEMLPPAKPRPANHSGFNPALPSSPKPELPAPQGRTDSFEPFPPAPGGFAPSQSAPRKPEAPVLDADPLTPPNSPQANVRTKPISKGLDQSAFVIVRTAKISYPNDPNGQSRDETFGSGVVIESEPGKAIILTAAHVLKNYTPGKYVLQVGARQESEVPPASFRGFYPATIIMRDDNADVALLRAKAPGVLGTVSLARHSLPEKRAAVRCAGFPSLPADPRKAQVPGLPRMVEGNVEEINRYMGPENFEFSGLIPQGFSGAAVLDEDNKLIGLAIAVDPKDRRTVCSPAAEIRKLLAATSADSPERAPIGEEALSLAKKHLASEPWTANAKFILRTEEAILYFDEWEKIDEKNVRFQPFAMIRFPKSNSSETPPGRVSSESAVVRFENEFNLTRPGAGGRIVETQLEKTRSILSIPPQPNQSSSK